MQDGLFVILAAAIILTALTLCFSAWLLWRRNAPLALDVPAKPLSDGGRQFGAVFEHATSLGKSGELITALMLAQQGWRQLPSQPTGVHGLDGLFVRRRLWGHQVMAVETKSSRDGDPKQNYRPDQMTDAAVIAQIERLADPNLVFQGKPYLSASDARRLVAAVRSGALLKRLASHQLGIGVSFLYRIRRNGGLGRVAWSARDERHRFMLQALAIGLSRLDASAPFAVSGVAMSAEPRPDARAPLYESA